MIKIKLLPRGKKHQITYRIVVAEQRSKSDGKCIDDLGFYTCLLYTSDAADDLLCVDLGGRRIIKKKKQKKQQQTK